jgi:hypothetical protein
MPLLQVIILAIIQGLAELLLVAGDASHGHDVCGHRLFPEALAGRILSKRGGFLEICRAGDRGDGRYRSD